MTVESFDLKIFLALQAILRPCSKAKAKAKGKFKVVSHPQRTDTHVKSSFVRTRADLSLTTKVRELLKSQHRNVTTERQFYNEIN